MEVGKATRAQGCSWSQQWVAALFLRTALTSSAAVSGYTAVPSLIRLHQPASLQPNRLCRLAGHVPWLHAARPRHLWENSSPLPRRGSGGGSARGLRLTTAAVSSRGARAAAPEATGRPGSDASRGRAPGVRLPKPRVSGAETGRKWALQYESRWEEYVSPRQLKRLRENEKGV